MSDDQSPNQNQTQTASSPACRPGKCRGRGRRLTFGVLFLLVAAALGLGASRAFGLGPRNALFFHGNLTPEQVEKRIDRITTWVMDDLKATPDQRQKVADIARAAAKDLAPVRQELHANHQRTVEILTAQTVDREAFETLRARQVQLVDTASKRVTRAVADAADVLSPEQRVDLAERLHSLHGH